MIGIVLGSKSDLSFLEGSLPLFQDFNVPFTVQISSAHRTAERTKEIVKKMEEKGVEIIIGLAGAAAHLPGVIASFTTLPVIGVPLPSTELKGIDSLFSIVQMPGGIPVASMAIGKAGVKNAVLFAFSVLALHDQALKEKISLYRQQQREKIIKDSSEMEKELSLYAHFFRL
ncbi:MAG TPA: 5-(carboxyamino)imidazole ribonucleotide mutase [Candidatus Aminicenantes bacterium]|nr:5-(carboxyamino)imidazole ribonucleotide mutase [Candidatus Aminicenantes bacterium]